MQGDSETNSGGGGDLVADVLVPVAVDTSYSYRVPDGMALAPGDFVTVPLGTRQTTGVVWASRLATAAAGLVAFESST